MTGNTRKLAAIASNYVTDHVRLGSCVTSTAGPNGVVQLYER